MTRGRYYVISCDFTILFLLTLTMKNKEECNFIRLLHRCEEIAASKDYFDWRLEKYIGTLQELLRKLRTTSTKKPSQEALAEYTHKVDFLKGLLETDKLSSSSERILSADLLSPWHDSSKPDIQSKELHLRTKARYEQEAKDELLGVKKSGEQNELRHRNMPDSQGRDMTAEDVDTVIKHQQELQEKLAEEMLSLARNMKEQATVAHLIVKEDNQKLTDSNVLADRNFGRLKGESERLEKHVEKSCNWWLWVMLAAVCFVFVWMIVFMRLFPKQ